MTTLSRWLAPLVFAAGLGMLALAPTTARADSSDDLVRVLVDVADVVLRGNQPYYRNGNYGYNDRLIIVRDDRGHPRYYRNVPRSHYVRNHRGGSSWNHRNDRDVKCNKHGKCKATYYDPRHDRDYRRGRRH